jgi:hypothetical protein
MDRWVVYKADTDKFYGPMLEMDVVRLAGLGKIGAEDMVRRASEPDAKLRDVKDEPLIFPNGEPPPPPVIHDSGSGLHGPGFGAAAMLRGQGEEPEPPEALAVAEAFEALFVEPSLWGIATGRAISDHIRRRAGERYLHPKSDERLLGVVDQTLFHTWRAGFALTTRRLYWKPPGRRALTFAPTRARCLPYEIMTEPPAKRSASAIRLAANAMLTVAPHLLDPTLDFLIRARASWRPGAKA